MDIQEITVTQCNSMDYELAFERAEKHYEAAGYILALPIYKSCSSLVGDKVKRSACLLRVISCELHLANFIANHDEYVDRLAAFKQTEDKFIKLERLKLLILLSEKSLYKIDALSIRSRIFEIQPWPRNANPYARCLLDSGAPKKAINILLPIDTRKSPKYVKISRLSILAECFDMLDDFDKSIYYLKEVLALTERAPAWISTKIQNLKILNGTSTETHSGSPSAIYHRIEEGDSSVIDELASEANGLSDEQIYPYITAVAALQGTPQAISVAKDLYSNTELSGLARCRALNFLTPYVPNSFICGAEVPYSYEFLELGLIKCETRKEFLAWLKQCPSEGDAAKKIIVKKILASDFYYGAKNSCSFNGESSIYRKKMDASKLVIIFCGLHGDLFYKPESLTYFFEDKDFSVLWLNDRSGNNFLTGLESYGNSGFEVTASLSSFIKENGYKDIVCLGASAGGSAAAFAGFALQVKKIVALSPPTFIKRDDPAPAMKMANKFIPYLTTKNFSLKEIFSNSKAPLLEIYYGGKSKPDCMYAEYMSGVNDVNFYPIKGWRQHAITDKLIRNGEFERIVETLFDT